MAVGIIFFALSGRHPFLQCFLWLMQFVTSPFKPSANFLSYFSFSKRVHSLEKCEQGCVSLARVQGVLAARVDVIFIQHKFTDEWICIIISKICFDQTHQPVGKTLEDVTRPDEMQARMWPVLTTICWKGVSYVISIREHQSLWNGRLAKPSPFFLLTVASIALNWHFLAWFLQQATSTSENWPPCRLLTTVVLGYQDKNLQTLSLRHSRVPVSHTVVTSERLARGIGIAKITGTLYLSA